MHDEESDGALGGVVFISALKIPPFLLNVMYAKVVSLRHSLLRVLAGAKRFATVTEQSLRLNRKPQNL